VFVDTYVPGTGKVWRGAGRQPCAKQNEHGEVGVGMEQREKQVRGLGGQPEEVARVGGSMVGSKDRLWPGHWPVLQGRRQQEEHC
jgi:hypothetical protein